MKTATLIISLFLLSCQQPFGVVDRIEGDVVVIELTYGGYIYRHTDSFGDGVTEGSVINYDLTLNEAETARMRVQNKNLLETLK